MRPYLIGDDITDHPAQSPRRHIIDFAVRPLEEASKYPAALEIVRQRVMPSRAKNKRKLYREAWWRFGEPRPGMRSAVSRLGRCVAANAQGKRILFTWQRTSTCPSNLTNVFAFEDDYAMGILTSRIHGEWASLLSSLEDRVRYTPTTSFETFPWPTATAEYLATIGDLSARIIAHRQEICRDLDIGLTTLYNQVDDGAWTDLRDLHRALDEAVAGAYGWPASVAHDPAESNRRLLELNRDITANRVPYEPFAYLDGATHAGGTRANPSSPG